jgi:amino acid transporter
LDTAELFLQYWSNPGAFNQAGLEPTKPHLDRFLAIISSIVQAAFGFSGIEIVSPFGSRLLAVTHY